MAVIWNPSEEKPVGMIADRNIYLDKSGEKLAAENSAESASLLIGRGREIDPADIARLGLSVVDGRVVQAPEEKAEEPTEEPAAEKLAPESPGESEG